MVLHVRPSADRLLKHLREVAGPGGRWQGIAHAFNGSAVQAQEFIKLGFKLGFGGAVTFERAHQLRHLAQTLPLDALAPDITRLAEKTWAGYQRELQSPHPRLARTVVLKLKTSDFRILTRSLTPPVMPDSATSLGALACDLRGRVELPAHTRYRLVGVGLSGFVDADTHAQQSGLFESETPPPM